MIERRDEELSHIYREAEARAPARVDDNYPGGVAAVAGTVRRPAVFAFSRRWGAPVAIAATRAGTSTVALMARAQSGVDTAAPGVRARTGGEVSPQPLCEPISRRIPSTDRAPAVGNPRCGAAKRSAGHAEPESRGPRLIERTGHGRNRPLGRTPRNGATRALPAIRLGEILARLTSQRRRRRRGSAAASERARATRKPRRMPCAPSTFNR